MRKLAGVFFEDGLNGLGRWCVEKHDRRHVFSKRLRDAGWLLSQHPHADAGMARREAEFDDLACMSFHVFRRGAVIKDDESVGAFERKTGRFQPGFDFVLLADNNIQPWVSLSDPVERSVFGEGWAHENDVIKAAAEWTEELVH